MPLTPKEFLADVAAVYTGGPTNGAFGSGRLIAPGLVLTAGHVIDYPTREAPTRTGWKVCLVREQTKDGTWAASPHTAELVWRGPGDLDLALLQVSDDTKLRPSLEPVFASIKWVEPIAEVDAAGFPEAWFTATATVRDYTVRGILRIANQLGPYAWSVPPADKPDDPHGWKGMSGASVCRVGPDDKLSLFGTVQEVPANFSHGQLKVARLSKGFDDAEFRDHLRTALGEDPRILPFKLRQSRPDLGIARIFQTRTRAFTDDYLVSETVPVPFGGRDRELDRLHAWLLNPNAPPRMLVTAPAGRGKSALLVQWMRILQSGGICGPNGWQLAFMPISIRVGTNRPEVFYEGLARRLAEITGETLGSEAIRDGDGFRFAVRDLLDHRIADSDRRVIIVIDGLDEALQGRFDPAILPAALPPNLRVLLSARWQVGDSDSKGWLKRLGWDRGVKVDSFELDRLDAHGIVDVLVKLRAPVDILAREPDLVERLVALTEGEPLLVRYYAEDLWLVSSTGARVTRADLDMLKPGFGSYFERWFDRQEELWQEEDAGIDRHEVDKVLSVLAFALGPLEEADLLALMEHVHGTSGVMAADRLLEPLRRFVFGDGKRGSGYVLSHPKIGDYLQQERFAAHAGELRRGFAAWGQAHLGDLNASRVQAEQASPYALQFLPQHLEEASARPEDFMMMVEDGWRRGWEHLEGGQRGFARAVQSAWSAQRREKAVLRLGAQWRCALTLSSVKSLGQNVPGKFALAAVQRGVLTSRQAAYFAEMKGPTEESVRLLAELAFAARDTHALSMELALSALDKARTARDETKRGALLGAAVEILFSVESGFSLEQRREMLGEALAAAMDIGDEYTRSRALAALAPHLLPEQLGEALASAKAIGGEYARSIALAALAPHLALEQLGEALASAKAIGGESVRSSALAALAPHLAPEQLGEALASAKAIVYDEDRASALAALAPHLLPEQLGEALASARAIGDEYARLIALAALALRLAPEQRHDVLGEALASARAIGDENDRLIALAALALRLAPEQRHDVLAEALAAARILGDGYSRSRALAALVPHLAPEQLGEALASAKAIGDYRSIALAALAPHLAPEQLGEALASAKAIVYDKDRASALAALAPHLAPDQLDEALVAAKAIRYNYDRSIALAALAPRVSLEQKHNVLGEALASAKAIVYDEDRASALAALAPYLAPEQLGDALAFVRDFSDENARSRTLAALAPHLAPDQLGDALAFVRDFGDENARSRALVVVAPHLAPGQLDEALVAAEAMGDENYRSRALTALAPHLAPEQLGVVLASAEAIGDENCRSSALAALAPHLTPELKRDVLSKALAAARDVGDENDRSRALAALAPHLAPDQLDEALALTRDVGDENYRLRALAALAPHLAPDQLDEALTSAAAIGNEYARSSALAALAPHLAPAQLGKALAAAKSIGHKFCRSRALAALAPHLVPEQRHDVLAEALASSEAISREYDRSIALAALAPHLAPDQLDEALVAAKAIRYNYDRSIALAALAPRVSLEQKHNVLGEALASAKAIGDENDRSRALATLAPYLTPELLGEALVAAKAIRHNYDRSIALAALAPRVSLVQKHNVLGEALASAKAIGNENDRSRALTTLAPYLSPELLGEALASANAVGDEYHRAIALVALAPHLAPHQRPNVLGEALTSAKAIGDGEQRSSALAVLVGCVPSTLEVDALLALVDAVGNASRLAALSAAAAGSRSTFELGGQGAVLELGRAINDVCRWYP